MKKISFLGVLVEASDWILHPFAYHKELMEYRRDFDKEVIYFREQIDKTKEKYEKKNKEFVETENKLRSKINEKEKVIKELNDKILDLEVIIENNLETIYKVRGKIGGTTKQINKIKKENAELKEHLVVLTQKLVDANNTLNKANARIKLLSSKTPREKINYTLMANEKMKRRHENETD